MKEFPFLMHNKNISDKCINLIQNKILQYFMNDHGASTSIMAIKKWHHMNEKFPAYGYSSLLSWKVTSIQVS